jgi:hypothetical protein
MLFKGWEISSSRAGVVQLCHPTCFCQELHVRSRGRLDCKRVLAAEEVSEHKSSKHMNGNIYSSNSFGRIQNKRLIIVSFQQSVVVLLVS